MKKGATHVGISANEKRCGFTLAEVLITLSIIGVVAALTIPQLVKNMNDYAYGKSKDTFDAKITEAMNQMKTNNEMDGYDTNEHFVDTFARYMKISKRCDSTHLTECFPSKVIASDGTQIDTVAKLRTGKDFGKDTYTSPLSAVQFSNGTTALIAYDPACVAQDAFNNQAVATNCLSMLYDINGFSKPNQAGKDIKMFNVDQLGTSCAFKIGSTCYGAPFTPTPMSLADCNANKGSLGIVACLYDGDYWAGAVSACGGIGKMPTNEQLDELANNLFGVSNCGPSSACGPGLNYTLASSYGLPSSGLFFLWSSMSTNGQYAFDRYFRDTDNSARNQFDRNDSTLKAVCIGN